MPFRALAAPTATSRQPHPVPCATTAVIHERRAVDAARERRELVAGLLATHAAIPPKYFYDERGARLFAAICEQPEYYPTRTEAAIFARHRDALRAAAGTGKELVDLGAGDCAKAPLWFATFAPARYVATATATAMLVDLVRTPIYVWQAGSVLTTMVVPLSVATAGVLIGTVLGERLLLGMSIRQFRFAIAILIGLLGVWLIVQGLN